MSWDNFYTRHIRVWLPFNAATGTLAHNRALTHHPTISPFTLHGTPAWTQLASGIGVLDFDATNPDWLDCGAVATAALNFTSGDFSMGLWAVINDQVTRTLLCRGVANTDGWLMQVSNASRLGFATFQAAGTQTTYSEAIVDPATWFLLGISRSGASIRTFINGEDRTDAPDTHVNPLTSARETHIGILDDETSDPWDGQMQNVRVWNRYLEPEEWLELFNMERHWFGV